MSNQNKVLAFLKRQSRWRIAGIVLILALAGVWFKGGGKSAAGGATFAARRGPLAISVLEGGSIQALESQEIKCEVRVGYQGTKILKIVEEGYQVTEDDVKTNKVLVELDSSELQKQIIQQEIQYQSAVASLTDAQQGYDIQLNQNISDIKAAEQKARFARMDFDKFLGDTVTDDIIDQLGLEKELAVESTNGLARAVSESPPTLTVPPHSGLVVAQSPSSDAPRVDALSGGVETSAQSAPSVSPQPASEPPAKSAKPDSATDADAKPQTNTPPVSILVDFSQYAKIDALGDGEAKQKLRKFEDDLQVAQKELGQAKSTLEGTRRLFEKGFVTKIDLERDDIAFENARLKVQTADTAL